MPLFAQNTIAAMSHTVLTVCDKKRLAPVEGEERGAYLCHLTIAERRAQPSFCMCGRALNGKSEVLISYDFIIIV